MTPVPADADGVLAMAIPARSVTGSGDGGAMIAAVVVLGIAIPTLIYALTQVGAAGERACADHDIYWLACGSARRRQYGRR